MQERARRFRHPGPIGRERDIVQKCFIRGTARPLGEKHIFDFRWGKPADFGGMAVYFASDASAFHTGDSVLIDGGYAIF